MLLSFLKLLIIPVLITIVFMIFSEMYNGKISVMWWELLPFFVWGFVLAFMYVSHIRIIESNLFAYFQAACVPGIARINHFLRFYQHSKSTVFKR